MASTLQQFVLSGQAGQNPAIGAGRRIQAQEQALTAGDLQNLRAEQVIANDPLVQDRARQQLDIQRQNATLTAEKGLREASKEERIEALGISQAWVDAGNDPVNGAERRRLLRLNNPIDFGEKPDDEINATSANIIAAGRKIDQSQSTQSLAFEKLISNFSPEDQVLARRQAAFLDPKPTSTKAIKIGNVTYSFNPNTDTFEQVLTPEQVAKNLEITEAGKTEGKVRTEKDLKREFARPQAANTLKFGLRAIGEIQRKVQGLIDHPGRLSATGGTSVLPTRPGGEASGFEANLLSLQADTALQALIEAKANGATFGALSDTELDLLKAKFASLSLEQPEAQFLENLNEINALMIQKTKDIQAAFDNEFGVDAPEAAQVQPSIAEGQTATGPNGEKIIFRNGAWQTN